MRHCGEHTAKCAILPFEGINMNREDVDKLRLGESKVRDIPTGIPTQIPIIGLPPHLQAQIAGGGQTGYQYHLTRSGKQYNQDQFSRTPEAALEALKGLLNWDPL
jgi:hypothetical protein